MHTYIHTYVRIHTYMHACIHTLPYLTFPYLTSPHLTLPYLTLHYITYTHTYIYMCVHIYSDKYIEECAQKTIMNYILHVGTPKNACHSIYAYIYMHILYIYTQNCVRLCMCANDIKWHLQINILTEMHLDMVLRPLATHRIQEPTHPTI